MLYCSLMVPRLMREAGSTVTWEHPGVISHAHAIPPSEPVGELFDDPLGKGVRHRQNLGEDIVKGGDVLRILGPSLVVFLELFLLPGFSRGYQVNSNQDMLLQESFRTAAANGHRYPIVHNVSPSVSRSISPPSSLRTSATASSRTCSSPGQALVPIRLRCGWISAAA